MNTFGIKIGRKPIKLVPPYRCVYITVAAVGGDLIIADSRNAKSGSTIIRATDEFDVEKVKKQFEETGRLMCSGAQVVVVANQNPIFCRASDPSTIAYILWTII